MARTKTRARILLLSDESQKKKKGTKEISSVWEKDRNKLQAQIDYQFKPDNARIELSGFTLSML